MAKTKQKRGEAQRESEKGSTCGEKSAGALRVRRESAEWKQEKGGKVGESGESSFGLPFGPSRIPSLWPSHYVRTQ